MESLLNSWWTVYITPTLSKQSLILWLILLYTDLYHELPLCLHHTLKFPGLLWKLQGSWNCLMGTVNMASAHTLAFIFYVCVVFTWLLFLECAGMRLMFRWTVLPVITVHSSKTAAGRSRKAISATFSTEVRDYRWYQICRSAFYFYRFKTGNLTFVHTAVEYLQLLNSNIGAIYLVFNQLCDIAFNLIHE